MVGPFQQLRYTIMIKKECLQGKISLMMQKMDMLMVGMIVC